MTQATHQPEPPPPVQNLPADAEPDDVPQLEDIGRDYERLSKRIATITKNARNGADISIVDALNLQGEVVMLLMDHLTHTKRMEDHAFWASEQLENIADAVSGDSETSSQLHKSDAAKYVDFIDDVLIIVTERICVLTPEGREPPDGLVKVRDKALELKKLTEDITLEEDSGDDEDDETTNETPTASEDKDSGEESTEAASE